MSVHTRFIFKLLAVAACATAAYPVTAQAVDNTRYISITGNNANACTLAAPCRTLQRGINATPQGGELRLLDSANYGGNVTVNRSMTISGNGHTLYLNGSLTIHQGGAVVALRGLTLNGQGTVEHGINIIDAATVRIERCVIHGFTGQGILSIGPDVEVFVIDSISHANGGSGFNLFNDTGAQRVTIDNSRFENNGANGVIIQSGRATIRRAAASGKAGDGIVAHISPVLGAVRDTTVAYNGNDGFTARGLMTVDSSLAYGNVRGLSVSNLPGSLARISNSTFIHNGTGLSNSGGTLETRGNNTVEGNPNNISGALTPITGK
jgi:hypothetical protein